MHCGVLTIIFEFFHNSFLFLGLTAPVNNEIFLMPIKGVTNTANKDARIERFERHYSSKIVLFRRDYATAPNNYKELLMQLWQYPAAKYKDCPDAIDSLVERIILGGTLHVGVMN